MKFLKPLPHLPVKNLQVTLDYYRDKLGFTDEWTFGETDGGIRRDDLRLLFAEDKDLQTISIIKITVFHYCGLLTI